MRKLAILLPLVIAKPAQAHDVWADGSPVPAWVKAACCGPREVHDLTVEGIGIEEVAGGYKIDGIDMIYPATKTLPSQDGHIWAFYLVRARGAQIHCLFIPWGS